ncbi:MAG TPA: hypothetical protein VNK41_10730 [Vicinamibacterales bacterium]|nr:hypothetical protein [Vicinamibacterales bacterium]
MSALREAVVLPLLLLTVVLLGGMRVAERVEFVPPALFTLVLAVLLLGTLIRSGALAPERLVHGARRPLATANGAIVLVALFLASAQAFHLVTPESGLPRLAFNVFLLVLLLNTWASSPDRTRLLRSLMVIFGFAFVLKFILLAAISDPASGRLQRMMQALLDGVTLGTLTQQPLHPVAGYLAFLTVALFLAAVALLPAGPRGVHVSDEHPELRVEQSAGELIEGERLERRR